MNTHPLERMFASGKVLAAAVILLAQLPTIADAKVENNPAGKVFVTEVTGNVRVVVDGKLVSLKAKTLYDAKGLVVETAGGEKVILVFSNGTSIALDPNTRLELKVFTQEPFTPNRTDMDVEPSISQMRVLMAYGTVKVSTSTLVTGSSMVFETRNATLNTLGGQFAIQSTDGSTKVSVLAGSCAVLAGALDFGGSRIGAGQQAIIQPGPAGAANRINVAVIPPAETTPLDDTVAEATMAKKTVYFMVTERPIESGPAADAAGANNAVGGSAPVSAFSGPVANADPNATNYTVVREIVAVQVVPTTLPVQFTVSPATLVSPASNTGG